MKQGTPDHPKTTLLMAELGCSRPLAVGLLYHATGGWAVPLGVLLVALVIQAISGLSAARPGTLEDVVAADRRAGKPAVAR